MRTLAFVLMMTFGVGYAAAVPLAHKHHKAVKKAKAPKKDKK